jgi:hypothetical protein
MVWLKRLLLGGLVVGNTLSLGCDTEAQRPADQAGAQCIGSKCDAAGEESNPCAGRSDGEFWCDGDLSFLCLRVGDDLLADVVDCGDMFGTCEPDSALCTCEAETQRSCHELVTGDDMLFACNPDESLAVGKLCHEGCVETDDGTPICGEDAETPDPCGGRPVGDSWCDEDGLSQLCEESTSGKKSLRTIDCESDFADLLFCQEDREYEELHGLCGPLG